MPAYMHISGTGKQERALRYRLPGLFAEPRVSALRAAREGAIREHEYWTAEKKTAGGNVDFARWCRDEAARWMRRYRAACHMLGWFDAPAGDRPCLAPSLWPVDLADELDHLFGEATL